MDTTKTGAYLAELRKARGMTQQEIADALHLSNKTISKWESGGGFPEITVLPALAELYGVTADEILAGEARERAPLPELGERKKYLLVRLRTRFDACFSAALALAVLGAFQVPYVSVTALPLSAALLWIGYTLVSHPLRYGDVPEGGSLYPGVFRKLFFACGLQWYAFLRLVNFGVYNPFSTEPSPNRWKPLVLVGGILLLWAGLQLLLGRVHGGGWLIPPGLAPWFLWSLTLYLLWWGIGSAYDAVQVPWLQEIALRDNMPITQEKMRQEMAQALAPYLWAKRGLWGAAGATVAGGGAIFLRRRKKAAAPLAQTDKK